MRYLNYKLLFWIMGVLIFFPKYGVAQDSLDYGKIEKTVSKYLTYFSGNNPGVVVTVMKKGDVIFNKAYGLSNVENNEQMTIDKAFNLAEISKSFTSLAVLKLVEKKKLSLDDNIAGVFNDFPEYGKKIKIRNLLNHTSGLKSYNTENIHSNNQVYDFLKSQNETVFEPGSEWQYSNSDYALLVKVIEQTAKLPVSFLLVYKKTWFSLSILFRV